MSGITVQQVLKRKYGVIVRHVNDGGKFVAEVVHNGLVVSRTPDDCIASGSLTITRQIWRSLPGTLLEYDYSPAYAYLQGKNIACAMASFDKARFEEHLLPRLRQEGSLSRQITVYEQHSTLDGEDAVYMTYDALVRLHVYAREHNITVERVGMSGYRPISAIEALTNVQAECICVGSDVSLLPALKIIHSEAKEHTYNDNLYLVKDKPVEIYSHAGGENHINISQSVVELLATGGTPEALPEIVSGGYLQSELRDVYQDLASRILGQGGVAYTPEEKELYDYHRSVCGIGKGIGRTALVGLGNIVGVGELGQRLDVLYREVRRKVGGLLGPDDAFKLAASRLANMNSAKVLIQNQGALYLEDRSSNIRSRPNV